jgi:hypothetical protein
MEKKVPKRIIALALVILMGLLVWEVSWADPEDPDSTLSLNGDSYLCSPRTQLRRPNRCTAYGPGGRLADYARRGIFPARPLPLSPIASSFSELPYSYLRVGKDGAKIYASLESAFEKSDASSSLEAGYLFVSWTDRWDQEGEVVYRTSSGGFIRGDNVSRISTPGFHGLAFRDTPKRPFGWIMQNGYAYASPGYDQPPTARWLYRYQVVEIYAVAEVGDYEWYMVGPDEWIEQRHIAKVDPDPTRPEGVEAEQWISINLFEQTLAVYENGQMVYATLVSSGLRGWWTRPGTFQVNKKLDRDHMRGAFEPDRSDYYYLEDVPWVLYFDKARALHGAYWHNNFGYPQSHGCVNLAPTDAHWIFDWAQEGTWVHVWDPSGQTPSEEENYGEGGA